jgi:hypothetical protein
MRRLMVMPMALVAFVAGLSAQQSTAPRGVGLGFAVGQEGSPLEIRATESAVATGAYTMVTVRNISSRVITGTTFAVRLTPGPGSQTTSSLREGQVLRDRIEPGGTVDLSANVVSLEELNQIARTHVGGSLELGVLSVQFANGGGWTSDVKTTGRFTGKTGPN